jgi:hypothetical protein
MLRIASGQICNMHDITSGLDHASQLLVVLFIYTQYTQIFFSIYETILSSLEKHQEYLFY